MHGRSIRNDFPELARVAKVTVYRIEGDPARLRLNSLFATADDDLEVRCEEICVMWPVCGAICGLK